ncbi:MAG: glycosyl transferase [Cereibacter sphaeroides]|uniref:Glycosyl transferase n=1 Tax=Cereibacter sphaeroides TaxID=1063 RepID=A0A2W5TV18_CERSP|nr:MAG: glycosyl transferase [Cereibacter sphaeroides]
MTVTILMATFNGAAYLPDQLDSLLAQSHGDWRLLASDDGSSDATANMLRAFGRAHPQHFAGLLQGPRRGSAANFLSLVCHPDLPPGPVAFCDQDDVWLRGKLARALRRIGAQPDDRPVIYAAESWLADDRLRLLRRSKAGASPGFANALVQNLCAGHTIVLNKAAVELARRAGNPPGIAFHDWWLYQLVTGAGGVCLLDPTPVALYRQHEANALGAPGGLAAMVRRADLTLGRNYAIWMGAHHQALAETGLMTPDAMAMLRPLTETPAVAGINRARLFRRIGLYRSGRFGTAALCCAAMFGRA